MNEMDYGGWNEWDGLWTEGNKMKHEPWIAWTDKNEMKHEQLKKHEQWSMEWQK